jgi:para-aminobenzoate synthetase component 2
MGMDSVLLVDNFDSFTYNVLHGLAAAGAHVKVRRADTITPDEAEELAPGLILISPGPGSPERAGLALALIERFAGRVPLFGVCLGMQCLAVAAGGRVGRAKQPVHGKTSPIRHDGKGIFGGVPSPFLAGRYHSLCVTDLPVDYEVNAWTDDGVPMAIRHRRLKLAGVQFHPDSFLTEYAQAMFRHVVNRDF